MAKKDTAEGKVEKVEVTLESLQAQLDNACSKIRKMSDNWKAFAKSHLGSQAVDGKIIKLVLASFLVSGMALSAEQKLVDWVPGGKSATYGTAKVATDLAGSATLTVNKVVAAGGVTAPISGAVSATTLSCSQGGTLASNTINYATIAAPTVTGTIAGGSGELDNSAVVTTNLTVYGVSRTTGVATNTGTVTLNGGLLTASGQTETKTGVTVTGGNYAAQSLTVSGTAAITGVLTNTGTVTFNGGTLTASGQTETKTGVTVTGGNYSAQSLTVSGATTHTGVSTNTGAVQINGGATVLAGQTLDLTGATVSGWGAVSSGVFNNAILTNATSYGTLNVAGVQTNTGVVTLNGGLLTASGQTETKTGVTVTGGNYTPQSMTHGSSGALKYTQVNLDVTNNHALTATGPYYVLNGIGSVNDATNTMTIVAPSAAGQVLILAVATASTNLITIADSAPIASSGALLLDADDTAMFISLDAATWSLVSKSDN